MVYNTTSSLTYNGITYTRGVWMSGAQQAINAKPYKYTKNWNSTETRIGGAGGYGIGFNASKTNGIAGSASSPSGGYSGGTGGNGGNWGANGSTGVKGAGNGTNGSSGSAGGKSIVGTSKLKPGSNQGEKSGSTSN